MENHKRDRKCITLLRTLLYIVKKLSVETNTPSNNFCEVKIITW